MRRSLLLVGVTAGAFMATTASAQSGSRTLATGTGTAFELTPYAGYMIGGTFLKGPLGTSISSAPAAMYGVQLGMKMSPNIALVGNVGYSASELEAGVPILGGVSLATSKMLLYDGGLQLDFPMTTASGFSLRPFVQAGAGAIRFDISRSVLETTSTSFAANAGLGADLAIGQSLGLRLMAKDYIGKFDFKEATSLDVEGETAHNWALTAGLRLSF
jgi:hypothetical protein